VRVPPPPHRGAVGTRLKEVARPGLADQLRDEIPDLARAHAHLAGGEALDLARGQGVVDGLVGGMDTTSGLMLPPAAMPRPPWMMAARSVMMSSKRFSVTIMS